MKHTINMYWGPRSWLSSLALGLLFFGSAPAYAVDKSVAACFAQITATTAVDETANGVVDALTEAADVGLPVMDVGIVLSLNQVNANLSDMLGPLTSIARSTCDTNDSLSSSASLSDFTGWIDAKDTEPLAAVIPNQIDGTTGLASPFARTVDTENTAAMQKMKLNLTDGYAENLVENQTKGLANMEGIALTGITSEKLAITDSDKNLEKLKAAGNIKDLMAEVGILINTLNQSVMRSNIAVQQQEVSADQRELFHVNERKMIHDDHIAMSKLLAAGI